MRYLILTLIGFFGPALLMFFLRLLWERITLKIRGELNKQAQDAEVIDVTPVASKRPSRLFFILWILISITCTGLLIWQLDDSPAPKQTYIPAHIDSYGNFVPSQTIPEEPGK